MDKEKQKVMQQKYMEMQMLAQQIQQLQKQLELLANQIFELNTTNEALESISKTNLGKDILVPVASGIFIKAQLKDNQDVLVNVGSGTAVKKKIPEAKELINEQLVEIDAFKKELESNLKNLIAKVQGMEKELSEIS